MSLREYIRTEKYYGRSFLLDNNDIAMEDVNINFLLPVKLLRNLVIKGLLLGDQSKGW